MFISIFYRKTFAPRLGRVLSARVGQSTVLYACGRIPFATSTFLVEVKASSSNQMVTLSYRLELYHASYSPFLGILSTRLKTADVRGVPVRTISGPNDSVVYFRTFIAQLIGLWILDVICELYPELLMHRNSDPLLAIVNAIRFFVNFLLGEKGQGKSQEVVKYLKTIMNHLLGGTLAKGFKSKDLLVPSCGVLKISGYKFLCLTPLREIQRVKDGSNLALIINYAVVVSLGVILECWDNFIIFFTTYDNYDNLSIELTDLLNSEVREILLQALGHTSRVIAKSKKLGKIKNANPERTRNRRANGSSENSPDYQGGYFLAKLAELELSGIAPDTVRAIHYILHREVILFDSDYRIVGDENAIIIVFNYEAFRDYYNEVGITIHHNDEIIYILPRSISRPLRTGYRISRDNGFYPPAEVPHKEVSNLASGSDVFYHDSLEISNGCVNNTVSADPVSQKNTISNMKNSYIASSKTRGVKDYREWVLQNLQRPLRPVILYYYHGMYEFFYLQGGRWYRTDISFDNSQISHDNRSAAITCVNRCRHLFEKFNDSLDSIGYLFGRELQILENCWGVINNLMSLKGYAKYSNIMYEFTVNVIMNKVVLKRHFFQEYAFSYFMRKGKNSIRFPLMLQKNNPIVLLTRNDYIIDSYILAQNIMNLIRHFRKYPQCFTQEIHMFIECMIQELSRRLSFFTINHSMNKNLPPHIKLEGKADIHISTRMQNTRGNIFVPSWLLKMIRSDHIYYELKKFIFAEVVNRLKSLYMDLEKKIPMGNSYFFITYDIKTQTFDVVTNNSLRYYEYNIIVFRVDIIISNTPKIRDFHPPC